MSDITPLVQYQVILRHLFLCIEKNVSRTGPLSGLPALRPPWVVLLAHGPLPPGEARLGAVLEDPMPRHGHGGGEGDDVVAEARPHDVHTSQGACCIQTNRAGHLRYFLILSIIRNDFLHFCQVN